MREEEKKSITKDIILTSCQKVARAASFAVAIIMLVYLPLMALEGVEGRMFRPMAITVAIALGAALLFSLTTFPAAVVLLYKEPVLHHSHYWDVLAEKYSELLNFSMNNRKKIVLSAIFAFIFSMLLGLSLGSEFVPRIDEGELAIDIKRLPSTGINTSRDLNLEIERELLTIPEVTGAVSRMGRGESAAEPVGSDEGVIMVKLKPKSEWESADKTSRAKRGRDRASRWRPPVRCLQRQSRASVAKAGRANQHRRFFRLPYLRHGCPAISASNRS
jgi:cobalt-zinc-cadmium resistance protein CzcA